MIGVRVAGLPRNPASAAAQRLLEQVRVLKVGTLVVFDSEVGSLPRLLNELQGAADVPLLVSADMERGLAFRIRRGVVPLPFAMALGATRSPDAARFAGEVAAREGRALGIHWAFAPVADVNNNPANPVINVRSFGEDPELVAQLVGAFVKGAKSGGLLTTAKHFPGHGDTAVDSHLQVASVAADRARLDAVELLPFRRAVEAGVDWVMMGHIAVHALDPSDTPATLSLPIADVLPERSRLHRPPRDGRHGHGRRAPCVDGGGGGASGAGRGGPRPAAPGAGRRGPVAGAGGEGRTAHRGRASTSPCGGSWRRRSAWAWTGTGAWTRRPPSRACSVRRTWRAPSRSPGSRSRWFATRGACSP